MSLGVVHIRPPLAIYLQSACCSALIARAMLARSSQRLHQLRVQVRGVDDVRGVLLCPWLGASCAADSADMLPGDL
jgi:hypothetical protein